MRIYFVTDEAIGRSVVDPRPTIEAEARADQGLEKALYWRHVGGNWELHSLNVEPAPRKVPA
jgi:hypothetical protein